MNDTLELDCEIDGGECDETVSILHDSIETNVWLSDSYFAAGLEGLAIECLREAWMEYIRFAEVLNVFAGNSLHNRLVHALVSITGGKDAARVMGLDMASFNAHVAAA